nr:phosphoribosylanthranilate isomerase [uncultured Oribacterium sp.]
MVVKYCGITKEEEIQHLQQLPIDYVGFVFYKKSKRYVDKEQARRLREKLNPSLPALGVFVEEEIPKILALLQEGIIQGVQLHGEEEEAYVLKLKQEMAKLGTKPFLWQAFILKEEKDIERANASPADLILLDGGKGEGKEAEAGLLQKIHRPYILAGGLSSENVAEKIKAFSPYGLDVSSGIEEQGEEGIRKSPEKMESFIRLVREYEKQTL